MLTAKQLVAQWVGMRCDGREGVGGSTLLRRRFSALLGKVQNEQSKLENCYEIFVMKKIRFICITTPSRIKGSKIFVKLLPGRFFGVLVTYTTFVFKMLADNERLGLT